MRACPVQHRRHRAGWSIHAGAVEQKHDPRHAPRHCQPVHRHREIGHGGGFALAIDQGGIGQRVHDRAKQQILLFHRQEVRAIDPDEIDRPAAVAPGRLLGHHAGHRLGRVTQPHMLHAHVMQHPHPLVGPGDERVGAVVPGPRVPGDRLALGVRPHRIPVQHRRIRPRSPREARCGAQRQQPATCGVHAMAATRRRRRAASMTGPNTSS